MNKILPNNTEESNAKVAELLSPALEYLYTLNNDEGMMGFYNSEKDPYQFKSALITIRIRSSEQ